MVQPRWAAAGSKIDGENGGCTTGRDGFRRHSRNTRWTVTEDAESRGLPSRIQGGEGCNRSASGWQGRQWDEGEGARVRIKRLSEEEADTEEARDEGRPPFSVRTLRISFIVCVVWKEATKETQHHHFVKSCSSARTSTDTFIHPWRAFAVHWLHPPGSCNMQCVSVWVNTVQHPGEK